MTQPSKELQRCPFCGSELVVTQTPEQATLAAQEAARRIISLIKEPWRPVLLTSERGELMERLGSGYFTGDILRRMDELENYRRDSAIVARTFLSIHSRDVASRDSKG